MLIALYVTALFLGSLLLFGVQLMYTKMVLPLLGGSPAVWNTAQVFFQATLFVGYLYAHLVVKYLPVRVQVAGHLLVLFSVLLVIPISIDPAWTPPAQQSPIPQFLWLLLISVGLPFFAVATTAPLLQRWFSNTAHAAASDPYFLYAASNLGGLFALLSYPLLVEPVLGLQQQSGWWMGAYVLLIAAITGAGVHLLFQQPRPVRTSDQPSPPPERLTWTRRAKWLILAFAPVSLPLGITLHISTDIAASPVLWVVPLALYLLSFIVVFARRPVLSHQWMVSVQPIVLIALALFFASGHLLIDIALHLCAFFIIAMVCHGWLARDRPPARHLTEFYLCISFGGVLGGVFAGIVAPLAFDSVIEYPLTLFLVCLLRP